MANNYESERRGSKSRVLERSLSYSEAIGNSSGRSSIEIPRMTQTEVYTNEEIMKQYRISQTYVEGKEIAFPCLKNLDTRVPISYEGGGYVDSPSSDDEQEADNGLVMTIDVETESRKSSEKRHTSDASTQPLVSSSPPDEIYESIEPDTYNDSTYNEVPSLYGYSTPYTSRRRRTGKKRTRHHGIGRQIRSRRVVFKTGEENVPIRSNIPAKSMKYMRDIVNTVINSKWRYLLLLLVVAHFTFWLFFASIWWVVTASYQDDIGDGKPHCVTGTSSFAGLLMMAVETQMTIGYGVRFPNEECPEAIIVMVLEIVAGTALSGGLTSLLFTKLIRPNKHVSSVGFSKKATVCLRDGDMCLQFRVWDLLNLHLIGSSITAYLLKPIRTLEGEYVSNYIHQLKLKESNSFLLWPITVVHIIDSESPLYDLSAQDMMDYRFEIVACLNGSSKSMGTCTQSRTSYLSKEIIWGYRFKNVLKYCKKEEAYIIDTDNLNTVEQVETPLCSASTLKGLEIDMKTDLPESLSPCEGSLLSKDDSLSPTMSRTGTQRSYGWNYRRFITDRLTGEE
ncbi:unnamed protein product [Pieris macdunnoughi]|uniref:Uncharacterized protein n=1 Tax=Pieris macdunnoughi TaxID=345717 RepID=A0A821Y477_9NEOP|nr:unnamed protein product [Pieris macdunnoughi]